MVLRVIRARTILQAAAVCVLVGAALRMCIAVIPTETAERLVHVMGQKVEDSYGKQVSMYAKSHAISVSPVGDSPPPATARLKQRAATVTPSTDRFMDSALEYKLQTTRTRSQRLEELQQMASSGSVQTAENPLDVQALIKLLTSARSIEEEAERVVNQSGLGKGVASMGEDDLRVFVEQVLAPDRVAVLGQAISVATGLPLEQIVVAQHPLSR